MSEWDWDSLIPLREKQSHQYDPSMEQIVQYGQYIGLEFPGDQSLLYIAKQGISATLPPQWQACQTTDGDMVYRNILSKQVTQQHPLDQYYKQKVQQAKYQRQFNSSNNDQQMEDCVLQAIEQEKNQFTDSHYTDQQNKEDLDLILEHQSNRQIQNTHNSSSSLFLLPYKTSSKQLHSKKRQPRQYQDFLTHFSEDFTLGQLKPSNQLLSFPQSPTNYPLKINHQNISPHNSVSSKNFPHKSQPHNQSSQTLQKLKQLNQQLNQHKNQKSLKQALLNQIKQTNKVKILLLKQKLAKNNPPKNKKINQKFKQIIPTFL